eukprot:TRINITY_DN26526_c0_g1_i1.p1 TRINITY_DN26526_c0_g1~~TRINITY_DN26526_c0_g1_i1.p1  ORF type:complete len:1002 (-),score=210.48 TRINITY_DN26526_c0_g1_i1:116-3076(-)
MAIDDAVSNASRANLEAARAVVTAAKAAARPSPESSTALALVDPPHGKTETAIVPFADKADGPAPVFYLSKARGMLHARSNCCGMLHFLELSCEETSLEDEFCSECFGHERIERETFEEKPAVAAESVDSAIAAGNQKTLVFLLRNFVGELLSGPKNHFTAKSGCASSAGIRDKGFESIGNQRLVRSAIVKILTHLDLRDEWILAATSSAREKLKKLVDDWTGVNGDLQTMAADGWQWQRLHDRLTGNNTPPLAITDGGFRTPLAIEGAAPLAICDKVDAVWEPSVSEFAGKALETSEITLTTDLRLSDLCVGTFPLDCDLTLIGDRNAEGSSTIGRRIRVMVNKLRVSASRRLRLLGVEVCVGRDLQVVEGGSLQCEDCLILDARRVLVGGKGSKMLLANSSVVGVSRHGVECLQGGSLFCEGSVVKNNSGSGLYFDGCAAARVRHTCIQANGGFGVHIEDPPASGKIEMHWVTMRDNGTDGNGPRMKFRRASASQDKPFRECRPSVEEVDAALLEASSEMRHQADVDIQALRTILTKLRALSADVVGLIKSAVLVRVQALMGTKPELSELGAEVLQLLQHPEAIQAFLEQRPSSKADVELSYPEILERLARAVKTASSLTSGGKAEKHMPRTLYEAGRALQALRWRDPPVSCFDMIQHGVIEVLSALEWGGPAPLPLLTRCLMNHGGIKENHAIVQAHLEARRALSKGFEGKKAAKHAERQIAALQDLLDLCVDLGAVLASGVGTAVRLAAAPEAKGVVPQQIHDRAVLLMEKWADRECLEAWADETVRGGDAAALAAAGADIPAAARQAMVVLEQEPARVGGGAEALAPDRDASIRCARMLAVLRLSFSWSTNVMNTVEALKTSGWMGGAAGGINSRLMKEASPPISGLAWLLRENLKEIIQERPDARKQLMKKQAKQFSAVKSALAKTAGEASVADVKAEDKLTAVQTPSPRRRKAAASDSASTPGASTLAPKQQNAKRQRC